MPNARRPAHDKLFGGRGAIIILRQRLCTEQRGRCVYCMRVMVPKHKSRMPTFDHVITLRNRGNLSYGNGVAACIHCNQRRDLEDAYQFYERAGWLSKRQRKRVYHGEIHRHAHVLSPQENAKVPFFSAIDLIPGLAPINSP